MHIFELRLVSRKRFRFICIVIYRLVSPFVHGFAQLGVILPLAAVAICIEHCL